jgi:hypothetical protein
MVSKEDSTEETIAHQPPGDVFPWPTGWRLTALDEVIIAIPAAVIGNHEAIGSVIHADEDTLLNLPHGPDVTRILIRLQVGQSAWLSRGCQAVVVHEQEGDTRPRRLKVSYVPQSGVVH